MPVAEKGIVTKIISISDSIRDITIRAPDIAGISKAGQFVHVRVDETFNPFLRRPFSVGPIEGDQIRLIFLVKGRGTEILARKKPGDEVDLIGPLGNPFQTHYNGEYPVLVAGGIGVVPLLFLKYQLPPNLLSSFLLGVRSESSLTVNKEEIKRCNIDLASDDGSIGFEGNVIQLLERHLQNLTNRRMIVYGCGPGLMLTALKTLCLANSIPAYVSLEVPMGCGVGACQSCAVSKVDGAGYFLVCQDGPVFNAETVDLNPGLLP